MYHIVFCGDEKYIKFIAVAIYSIVKNTNISLSYKNKLPYHLVNEQENQKEQYHFHIISDKVSAETIKKIELLEKSCSSIFPTQIELHFVDETVFFAYPKWNGSYGPYFRLLADDILDSKIQYFLYLDGDVAVYSDVREIFLNDVSKVCLGAVVEEEQNKMKKKPQRFCLKSRNGTADFNLYINPLYFNTGVLLINRKIWKEMDVKNKTLQFLNEYIPKAPDQDALNVVTGNNFKPLGFEWNTFYYDKIEENFKRLYIDIYKYNKAFHYENTIKIRHYFIKPWNTDSRHFSHFRMLKLVLHDEWWELAKNTPVFSNEIMCILDSDAYKRKIKKINKRAFRYKYFKIFYMFLRLIHNKDF